MSVEVSSPGGVSVDEQMPPTWSVLTLEDPAGAAALCRPPGELPHTSVSEGKVFTSSRRS